MDIISTKIEVINNIKPILIESFVEFFGEENRLKIKNIINNLTIGFMDDNLSYRRIKKIKKKIEHSISTILKNQLNYNIDDNDIINIMYAILLKEDKDETLDKLENIIIKYFYYDLLASKKENDFDKKIYLGSNNDKLISHKEKIRVKKADTDVEGFAFMKNNNHLIFIQGHKISITVLIHEITHLLSKEIEAELFDANGKKEKDIISHGISTKRDLIGEIITDLISEDVIEIFKKNCTNHFLLDFKQDSLYILLDLISYSTVKHIYEKLKPLIKQFIISGEGYKIKNIIGKNTYKNLECLLKHNLDNMIKIYKKSNTTDLDDFTKSKNMIDKEAFDEVTTEINQNYEDYLTYTESLNNLVDELVSNEKARRVK